VHVANLLVPLNVRVHNSFRATGAPQVRIPADTP